MNNGKLQLQGLWRKFSWFGWCRIRLQGLRRTKHSLRATDVA